MKYSLQICNLSIATIFSNYIDCVFFIVFDIDLLLWLLKVIFFVWVLIVDLKVFLFLNKNEST